MPSYSDPDLPDFLREWREPVSARRVFLAGGGSLVAHAFILAALLAVLSVPDPPRLENSLAIAEIRKAVPLVAPRFFELTQKAPNQGKVTRELDVRSALPAPREQAPARFQPPSPAPGPPMPAAPVVSAEPPKIEIAAAPPPAGGIPPQPAPERARLAFESVGSGPISRSGVPNSPGIVPAPKTSIQEAVRAAGQPGGSGGITVGDALEAPPSIAGMNPGLAPGPLGSQLQLLSDPTGVDFKPYLIQVLTAVRHNWMAVVPESARLGRKGQVLIQFIIDRKGEIPKLVIATPSGTEALDRAAIAGISASYPFPPLPAAYKGDQIRLQLAFSYNMRSR